MVRMWTRLSRSYGTSLPKVRDRSYPIIIRFSSCLISESFGVRPADASVEVRQRKRARRNLYTGSADDPCEKIEDALLIVL